MARIPERLPPLNALRAFEASARLLSFKKASRELHVTPGAVSHQIKVLEASLGVALFRRLTRALELTPAGRAMLPKVQQGLESLVEAAALARGRRAHAALTVIAPPNFTARWLVPRLGRFTRAHPEVELHLVSRPEALDRREEPSGPAPETPLESPVLRVRFGAGRYPGANVDELFTAVYLPACSPGLLDGEHPLRMPADLRFHTLLHDDTAVAEGARPVWADWLEAAHVQGVDPERGPHFSDSALALDAAIEGMGVTLTLKPLVRAEVEAGRLVVPFDIAVPATFSYCLVTPQPAQADAGAAAFRTWLLGEAAAERG
jgi:LysR family glycine cleavage system transcriptional activator